MCCVLVAISKSLWEIKLCFQLCPLVINWVYLWLHTHACLTALFLSGTTQVSQYQKGKTSLDFTEVRDTEWHWHQLGHMQVCTLLQIDNHASTPPLVFYRLDALPAAQRIVSKHRRHKFTCIMAVKQFYHGTVVIIMMVCIICLILNWCLDLIAVVRRCSEICLSSGIQCDQLLHQLQVALFLSGHRIKW